MQQWVIIKQTNGLDHAVSDVIGPYRPDQAVICADSLNEAKENFTKRKTKIFIYHAMPLLDPSKVKM